MNTALTNLLAAAANDETPVSAADVVALSRQYPFFTLPAVMLLRREGETLAPELRTRLMQQIALNAPDAEALSLLADPELDEWRNLYPVPDDKKITTSDAISTFLNRYGPSTPQEDALLEKLIFNPTPDYASILARDEVEHTPTHTDDNSNDALIDNFIRKTRVESPRPAAVTEPQTPAPVQAPAPVQPTPPEPPAPAPVLPPAPAPAPKPAPESTHHPRTPVSPDTSLSESLAKIYIRQKRYDKAFEIIHTLSLNNPKKSVYFADQLRFLRKLMLNRNLANGENKL